MILRDLTTLDDCRRVVALEKEIWSYTDAEDVVPAALLIVAVKRGGILIGAFDDGGELCGFVYSVPSLRAGRLAHWSHMLGVIGRARDAGLGVRLKVAQRRRALDMGIDLIEWTYDPLQAANAHLNLRKLGAIVEEYEENVYGESSSPLHSGTATDRFIAQWHLDSARVRERLDGPARPAGPAAPPPPVVNRTRTAGGWPRCESYDLDRSEPRLAVEIPSAFGEMQQRRQEEAAAWRLATRDIFTTYLTRGYRVVDFLPNRATGTGWYVLANAAIEEG